MSWGKQLLGTLAATLGAVGVLACLAGLAGVWILNHRLQAPLARVADEATALCVTLEDGAAEAAGYLQSSREMVREMEAGVGQWTRNLLELSEEDVARIENIGLQLRTILQRVNDWVALIGAAVDFGDRVFRFVESTALYVRAEAWAKADLLEAVSAARADVEEAMKLLEEVETRLAALRADPDLAVSAGPLRTLVNQIDGTLAQLQADAQSFESGVALLRAGVEHVGRRVRRALLIAAGVLTLLLLWQAAAQAALVNWGWRTARASPQA